MVNGRSRLNHAQRPQRLQLKNMLIGITFAVTVVIGVGGVWLVGGLLDEEDAVAPVGEPAVGIGPADFYLFVGEFGVNEDEGVVPLDVGRV